MSPAFSKWPWLVRGAAVALGIAVAGGAVWRVSAQSDNVAVVTDTQPATDIEKDATPMAQRVATIGFLNKRNGLTRDFQMKPGDNFRVADGVIIRLRACDKTAPWEPDPYSGAFVQVDVQNADNKWARVFSGWLYKESPGLNVVEHPIYDVWVKDCKMSHGEPASDVQKPGGDEADSAHKSKAKKSAEDATAPDTASPADGGGDTAEDNSAR